MSEMVNAGVVAEPAKPPVRGIKTAWTLGIVFAVLFVAGGVGVLIMYRDVHRWNAAIADQQVQIKAMESHRNQQSDRQAQQERALASANLDARGAAVPVVCAAAVQPVWNKIKARDFTDTGPVVAAMVRACNTDVSGPFTITVRI